VSHSVSTPPPSPRDLVALVKPHIVLMSVLMAAGGLALAPADVPLLMAVAALSGTGAIVGGASALNMVMERDRDRLMARTRARPLPAGRLGAPAALWLGLALSALALALLGAVNVTTALLGAVGLMLYLLAYTPLKTRSSLALPVGAVAGALPPLMGWTAATGAIGAPGGVLFLTLFLWQLPHFIAISLYREHEYARAGFVTLAHQRGHRAARQLVAALSLLLVLASLLLVALGAASWFYGAIALGAGLWLLGLAAHGLRLAPAQVAAWARSYFKVTLSYLPLLALGLMVDRWLVS
jgi:protoheme IX farnesyltransferase